jgi:hypothetical protein
LQAKLAGREMTVAAVKEYVLTDTPCYLFKAALKKLETAPNKVAQVLKAPQERTPGTYPDGMLQEIVMRFVARTATLWPNGE